jgi:hypothetical protein
MDFLHHWRLRSTNRLLPCNWSGWFWNYYFFPFLFIIYLHVHNSSEIYLFIKSTEDSLIGGRGRGTWLSVHLCLVIKFLTWRRLWEFKFSRRRVWCSELSSGIYCHVKWLSTDASEVHTASITHLWRQFWTSWRRLFSWLQVKPKDNYTSYLNRNNSMSLGLKIISS